MHDLGRPADTPDILEGWPDRQTATAAAIRAFSRCQHALQAVATIHPSAKLVNLRTAWLNLSRMVQDTPGGEGGK